MSGPQKILSILPFAVVAAGCATPAADPAARPAVYSREQIFVLRSIRVERTPNSTWCTPERAGFVPAIDDRFSFWTVETDPRDGRVTNAMSAAAGEGRSCLGMTNTPGVFNFYVEGKLDGIPYLGNGDCAALRPDFPEKGIAAVRCAIQLRGLPPEYAGGVLISNTVSSPALFGVETDPPGFLQSSIATIRLWRTR